MPPLKRLARAAKALSLALAVAAAALLAAPQALADKVTKKDGTVLEGTIVREGDGFIFLKVKVGGVESQMLIMKDEISKIERDDTAPKTDENIKKAEDDKKADPKKDEKKHTGATRVALLHFGGPSDWQGKYGDMVGVQVSAEAFKKAIPLLEKAKADVVVVQVNSGGGYGLEVPKFNELFDKEYKPRFRTVAWIESAISAAAMSPWVIEEMYFMQKGNIGACTGWSGNLVAVKGIELEQMLANMEHTSDLGKKDRRIMRAMQIQEPLSVDVDENGEVHWRQDDQGQYILNPRGQVFTMNANDAIRFKFGRGIANTKEELAKAMGLQEVEWVAQDATDLIDKSIRDNDAAEKRNKEVLEKYLLHIGLAEQLPDKDRRGAELSIAKKLLAELRRMVSLNPNFVFHLGIPPEWFAQQDELIKRIAGRP
jgi:RNA binding exosome subunit